MLVHARGLVHGILVCLDLFILASSMLEYILRISCTAARYIKVVGQLGKRDLDSAAGKIMFDHARGGAEMSATLVVEAHKPACWAKVEGKTLGHPR